MSAPDPTTPTTPRLVSRRGLAKALAYVLPAGAFGVLAGESPAEATTSTGWSLQGNRGTGHRLGSLDKEPLLLFTAGHERARIDSVGRVGIGTHKPTAPLQVVAGAKDFVAIYGTSPGVSSPFTGAVAGVATGAKSTSAGVAGFSGGKGPGVLGFGNAIGVQGVGERVGVAGSSSDQKGAGVKGTSTFGGSGVSGTSDNGAGVLGTATDDTGTGVVGVGNFSGITGSATTQGPNAVGVAGTVVNRGYGVHGTAGQGYGVYGEAQDRGAGVGGTAIGTGFAIYGKAPTTGYAGYFDGNTATTGTAAHNAIRVITDHPLKPATHALQHAAVTAPATTSTYTGQITLGDDGVAQVALPDYVAALDAAPHVQLTGVGPQPVWLAAAATGAGFTVRGAAGQLVYWQAVATHHDTATFETAPSRVRHIPPNVT
jgi:hypothetical protein